MARYVVTGATGGIGRMVAETLARTHEVIALVRTAGAEPPCCSLALEADLGRPETVEPALSHLGPVDGVVHCAGVIIPGRLASLTTGDWLKQWTVNVAAAAEVTRVLLPPLREARGSVVFLNSGAGQKAHAGLAGYGSSKFGLRALADCLREEEPSIRVTTLYPGPTRTAMQAGLSPDDEVAQSAADCLDPRTVANVVLQILETPREASIPEMTLRPRPRD